MPGDIGVEEFRHLENVRWDDPRLVSRGGQQALLAGGQAIGECILGMVDVSESVAILVGSEDFEPQLASQRRIDRYSEDQTPTYLSPAMSPDDDTNDDWPQELAVYNNADKGRHCFINFAGKILSYNETTKRVMKVNFPPLDTPTSLVAENTHFVLEIDLGAYPQMASWTWHYELDKDEASPTFDKIIPVLYMGLVGGAAIVLRWDGRNLTQDTVNPLALSVERVIVGTWGNDITACIDGPLFVRNFNREGLTLGNWNITIPLDAGVASFHPTSNKDAFGRPFLTGWGSHQLLYYNPATKTMIGRAPTNPGAGNAPALYAADSEVFDGFHYYLWTETGHPSVPANLGRVDGSFTFTDVWDSFDAEFTGWTERLLATGESLFALFQSKENPGATDRGGLYGMRTPATPGTMTEVVAYGLDEIPADMVAI